MTTTHHVHLRTNIARACFVVLVILLTGCHAFSGRVPSPTPTPILLDPDRGSVVPSLVGEATAAAPTLPASPSLAIASPTAMPEPTPVSTQTLGMLALGTRDTIVLRAQAAISAAVIARVPGSHVLRAQGRNAAGDWLWVVYGEAGQQAWVAAADVKLMGDVLSLADITSADASKTAPKVVTTPIAPAALSTAHPTAPIAESGTPPPVPARTQISTTPLPGKIAFQTAIGGEIYLVNADGTGLRRVAAGFDPALSPDGAQLAFVRWGTPDGVYLLDLQSGQERLVAMAQRPRNPAWSPDNARIVFSHNTGRTTCLDTPFGCLAETDVQRLFNNQECINLPQGRICIADFPLLRIDSTALVQLTMGDGNWLDLPSQRKSQSPSLHPRRDEILYAGEAGLQILPLGESTQPLVDDIALGSPAWSPDGTRILAQAFIHDHWDIVLLDATGNTLAQLTAPDPLSARKPNNVAPAWAPDGRSLLFLSDRDGSWRMYRMHADGSQQAPFLPQVLGRVTLTYGFSAERVMSWAK